MTADYFKLMKETSLEADLLTERYLSKLDPFSAQLPRKRLSRPRLRDLVVRVGYEISKGINWRETIPICVSYELLNCSTYVFNWIFDKKNGGKSSEEEQELTKRILAGIELRELSEKVLIDNGLLSLIRGIHEINTEIYRGQRLDLHVLISKNIDQFKDCQDFIRIYNERCSCLCGDFFGHCLSDGAKLGQFSFENTSSLYEIGCLLGTGIQASNDLGDLALPHEDLSVIEKPYQDQLSDLKQGKLTLPIYLMRTRGTKEERELLEEMTRKEELTEEDYKLVMRVLQSTGAFESSMDFLKDKRKKAKKMLYESFNKSEARDLIASMLVAIVSNKFLTSIKNLLGCQQNN